MVWIHGGALITGSGGLGLYHGASLAERGVVMVTINYRLGTLGFFSHPALDKENRHGTVNFGLLDQIAALRWVQENIAAFGGDANNVTIFGESSGAESILALFASPLARGLFHRGISQSPFGLPSHTRSRAQEVGIRVASRVGLDGADATMEELRRVPAEDFGPIQREPGMSLMPCFIFGDEGLPKPILAIFREGEQAQVPLIVGSNSWEASVGELFGLEPEDLIALLGAIGEGLVKLLYPNATDNRDLGRKLLRDLIFVTFAKRIAEAHARCGVPAWRYYFTYVAENSDDPGVAHGAEIIFVMDSFDTANIEGLEFTETDRAIGKRVSSYWLSFAHNGEPNPEGEPEWRGEPALLGEAVMKFGKKIKMVPNFMWPRLSILQGLLVLIEQLLTESNQSEDPVGAIAYADKRKIKRMLRRRKSRS